MIHYRFFILWIGLTAGLLPGCTDHQFIWEQSVVVSPDGWDFRDTAETEWIPEENHESARLVLEVTHDPYFSYQNLYLTGMIRQGSRIIYRDTFSIQLAGRNSGRWLGERKKGDLYIKADTLGNLSVLSAKETVVFSFTQFSRDSILNGISEIRYKVLNGTKDSD